MSEQTALALGKHVQRGKDLFLSHTGVDKPWVEKLAELIEATPFQNRYLGVIYDKWDFAHAKNIVLELEKEIDECRFIGIVASRASLAADWPTLERTIAVWSDPTGNKGRVIPILIENAPLPPSLRVRRWVDFRNPETFEQSFIELVSILRGESIPRGRGGLSPSSSLTKNPLNVPLVITSAIEADKVDEKLISNLLPVLELPELVYVSSTPLREKSDLRDLSTAKSHPPFLLRSEKLFTLANLRDEESPFRGVIERNRIETEPLNIWFGNEKHAWAVELLNLHLKAFAYDRYLRFERKGQRFFFSPYKDQPKTIRWSIGGRQSSREVTTPHTATRLNAEGNKERFDFGWRHQGIRANFVHLPMGLFLRIEPTWLLTKDGKVPRGGSRVGPVLSHWLNQERNGQILRSIRFWSLVLARGGKELHIPTGQQPIRIGLTPARGLIGFGIIPDTVDYDRLISAEMEDDLAVPELEPENSQFDLFPGGGGENP
jgi:TIR domain